MHKKRYLFAIYGFCHKPHILLHNSFLWKSINKFNDEMALISIAGIGKGKQEHCGQWGRNIKRSVISNRRHFFIYRWIFKSNSSKDSYWIVEYDTYD